MKLNLSNLLQFASWRWGFWIRVNRIGFSISKAPALFSERFGHFRCFRIGMWRLKILPKN